jgi:hypothetical protein
MVCTHFLASALGSLVRAGPRGRRGDQVGGFILQHQSDLRRMAPLWLKFSEDVRADPDVSDASIRAACLLGLCSKPSIFADTWGWGNYKGCMPCVAQ